MKLGKFLINGLHLILVIENILCQLISLIKIWQTLAAGCLKVLYWAVYCFSSTYMTCKVQLNIVKCITLLKTLT